MVRAGRASKDCASGGVHDSAVWRRTDLLRLSGYTATVVRRGADKGIPIVACHSAALDHRMWAPIAKYMDREIPFIAWDIRNHGPCRTDSGFSIARCTEDLSILLETLEIKRAHIIGISMGGAIAQQFAISKPHLLAGLTLMATSAKGNKASERRALDGEVYGLTAQVDETLARWFSRQFIEENGPWVQYARECIEGWTREAWAGTWRGLATRDTTGHLEEIGAPTLCIAGDADRSTPLEALSLLANKIPTSTLLTIRGSHLFPLENPREVASTIVDHHLKL